MGVPAFAESISRDHRQQYGREMDQVFLGQCRNAWSVAHWRGLVALWLRVLPDLVKTSVLEHVVTIKERKPMTVKKILFLAVSMPVLLLLLTASYFTLFRPEYYSGKARIIVRRDAADIPTSLTSQPYFTGVNDPHLMQQNKMQFPSTRNSNIIGSKVK